jgi:hypothetical protein
MQPPRGKSRRYISYWTASAIARRDFRHDFDVPGVPVRRAARKDTKRWCRGKVGREHQFVWGEVRRTSLYGRTQTYACRACGKVRNWRSWFVGHPAE